jgi:D-aminoacyl-tRNA deacylase
MRTIIVCSLNDPAGTNIRERLIESYDFKETDDYFFGSPIYSLGQLTLVSSPKDIVFVDGLDENFHAAEGVRYVFISRHRAESGIPSLTAHFTGNFGDAAFGGRPSEIARFSPALLKNYMISLAQRRRLVEPTHNITLEATHHGPTSLKYSVVFVELGSTQSEWKDPALAKIIADSLMDAIASERKFKTCGVGIGGMHYPEKLNRIEIESNDIALGPIVPKYALEFFDSRILEQIVTKSEQKVELALIDQKGLGRFNLISKKRRTEGNKAPRTLLCKMTYAGPERGEARVMAAEDYERLRSLIVSRAVETKSEGFVLASGRRSTLYIDLRKITQDPEGINLIGRMLLSKIRGECPDAEFVGGLETGSIPISTAIALLSFEPGTSNNPLSAFWVRKKPKDHGLQNRIEGNLSPGGNTVIVDDTITTGASSLTAVEAVKEFGARVIKALSIVDRGAGDTFRKANIPYSFLYSEEDLVFSR